jgi:type IV secretory pathway VirB9-like protein
VLAGGEYPLGSVPGTALHGRNPHAEPINSVAVGDPASFSEEHLDREPSLVFVKPITTKAAQTNLLILTARGLQRAESELHIEDEGRHSLLMIAKN